MHKCPTNWSQNAFVSRVFFWETRLADNKMHSYTNDGSGPPWHLNLYQLLFVGITLMSFNVFAAFLIDRPASMVSHFSHNRQTGDKTPADDVEGTDSWDERKCGALLC